MEMICLNNVKKKYGQHTVLNGVSFTVDSDDFVGYLGPNGSGKTTTIKIICGLCKHDSGLVHIKKDFRHNISAVFEYNGLYPSLTAKENLEFFSKLMGIPVKDSKRNIDLTLSSLNLLERKNSLIKTFSKGMLRRLAIARSIITEPTILILDEPFDGIDIESRSYLIQMLKQWKEEANKCVILTSHIMADIEALSNKILIIKEGQIITSENINDFRKNSNYAKKFEITLPNKNNCSNLITCLKQDRFIWDVNLISDKLAFKTHNDCKFSDIAALLIYNNIEFENIKLKSPPLEEIYLEMINT